MKTHLDIKHTGTLDGDVTRMDFDAEALTHLMSVLTDLYSDKEMAVIREISTNARDSHIAAGKADVPIEVTLPSPMEPTFVVKDQGLGMSWESIVNYFGKYGASSKRESDDFNGMLGLGCKAPLSYTSQFTLTSVHDGKKMIVLVTRDEAGRGALQVIDESDTDEPNGVEIAVPVSGVKSFNVKAGAFYRFWEPGEVLVNGEQPYSVWTDPSVLKLDDDVVVLPGVRYHNNENLVIVMGGVAYPVPSVPVIVKRGYEVCTVAARVPIGTINFVPSREAAQDTKRTKAVVDAVIEFIDLALHRAKQARVNAAKTAHEAWVAANEVADVSVMNAPRRNLTYLGAEVPKYVPLRHAKERADSTPEYPRYSEYPGYWITVEDASRSDQAPRLVPGDKVRLWVWGVMRSPTVDLRKALAKEAKKHPHTSDANGWFKEGRLLCTPLPPPDWCEGMAPVKHISEIPKIPKPLAPPKAPKGKKTTEAIYREFLHNYGQKYHHRKINSPAGFEAYVTPKWLKEYPWLIDDIPGAFRRGVLVVYVNEETAFRAKHPEILPLPEAAVAIYKKMISTVPDWVRYGLNASYRISDSLATLEPEQVKQIMDPELRWVYEMELKARTWLDVDGRRQLNRLGYFFPAGEEPPVLPEHRDPVMEERVRNILKPYHLARTHSMSAAQHLELLNALYVTRRGLHLDPRTY